MSDVGYWTKSTDPSGLTQGNWIGVASSSNGQYCIASNDQDEHIWVSSDYGVSWSISSGSPTSVHWGNVTISQSGNKLAACEDVGGATYNVYVLDIPGANTWVNITPSGGTPGNSIQWTSVCYSIDENTLACCDGNATVWIYYLSDETWTNPPDVDGNPPRCNVCSSNIYGFVGIGRNNWMYTIYGGPTIYTTGIIDNTNSNINDFIPNNPAWTCISSSLDGNTLCVCAESNNYIYVGTLASSYWTFVQQTLAGAGDWKVVAMGPDSVSIGACNGDGTNPGEIWVGNKSYGSSTYAWERQVMQNGSPLYGDWKAISRSTNPNQLTKFITLTKLTNSGEQTGIWVFTSYKSAKDAQSLTCFLKDTKILTNNGYVSIQNLKKGDLVKTLRHGFVPIENVGRKDIYNPSEKERIANQLYICSKEMYPDLLEDLVITGCHSILADEFKEGEREKTIEIMGKIYVTDKKYRLPACVDQRASIYKEKGEVTIYHLALENDDFFMNYGIFANGLLVETCSKRYLKDLSDMTLL